MGGYCSLLTTPVALGYQRTINMILHELTSVAIIAVAIVAVTWIVGKDTYDDDQCMGFCLWCRDTTLYCMPDNRTRGQRQENDALF